jgi:3-deoxy-7-phosphoheptulonate synthase
MVDCSHGNSLKDYRRQPEVAAALCGQIANGSRAITAVMIESNLVEGSQKLGDNPSALVFGQSVTDSCISWPTTEAVLAGFAEAVRKRRSS